MATTAPYHAPRPVISSPAMRARRTPPALVLGVSAALAVSTVGANARATDCGAPLLSTCIDSDNLWPHAGSAHFLSVGATDTVEGGQVGFGLVTTYLSRPITITAATPGPGGSLDYVIDNQVTTTFLWSYGMTDRLELDLVLPVTLGQSGTGTGPITGAAPENALSNTATRDLRFGFAYALLKRDPVDPYAPDAVRKDRGDGFGLAARFEVSAPTGDSGEFATNGTAVWMPGVSADYRYRGFFAGAEAGLRLRPTQEFAGGRIGNQAYLALGAAYDVLSHELLSLGAEAFLLPTFAEQHSTSQSTEYGIESAPDGKYITPAEWMLSARTAPLFGGSVQIQLAGGGPIPFSSDSITNPRFRFSVSLRYARQGRDSDGDGVKDDDDKCPFEPGLPNNPAGRGCPASATTEKVDLTGLPVEPAPAPVQVPATNLGVSPEPTPIVTWPPTPNDSPAQPR